MTIATTERRLARGPAVRGYGEQEPLAAPFRSDGSGDRDPLTLRRWRVSLARNVNLLHPRAKTVFAMRVLDRRLGFRSRSSVRLERHFGLRLPSALLFGLEPENTKCKLHTVCSHPASRFRPSV